MAYDESVDNRVQNVILQWNLERKKMFGGTCYLSNGNMVCGVNQNKVILRIGKDTDSELVRHPSVSPFDMTGRPMSGWYQVPSEKVDDLTLIDFLEQCYAFASKLPAKSKK